MPIKNKIKNNLIIVLVAAIIILQLFVKKSIFSAYAQLFLIIIILFLLFPEMTRMIKELKHPKEGKLPEWFVKAEKKRARGFVLFMAIFFIVIGLINLKLRFLGVSELIVFKYSIQIALSMFLIFLGAAFLFISLLKFSDSFRKFVNKNYFLFSKLLLILILILAVILVVVLAISNL